MKTDTGAIGVLGGVGPYAGLDLMRKIFDQTRANCDQDHLSVIQFSLSEHIIDRTRFLLGETDENPGEAIGEIMVRMAKAGATVIGVPCNTAHSPRIMDKAVAMLHEAAPQARFVHMIDAVIAFIRENLPEARTIGVLSTKGTLATGLYQDALSGAGFVPLFPDEAGRGGSADGEGGRRRYPRLYGNPAGPDRAGPSRRAVAGCDQGPRPCAYSGVRAGPPEAGLLNLIRRGNHVRSFHRIVPAG